MRTTVEIDDKLFRAARKRAIDERRSFKAVLSDALRAYVGSTDLAPVPTRLVGGEVAARDRSAERFKRDVAAAEFWAMVCDRSRWDELLGGPARSTEGASAVRPGDHGDA